MKPEAAFEIWRNHQRHRNEAQAWQALGEKRTRDNTFCSLSLSHCESPTLVRAGQFSEGGQNYWSSPEGLNRVLLEYILENWPSIWPILEARLEAKSDAALLACRERLEEMQECLAAAEARQQVGEVPDVN